MSSMLPFPVVGVQSGSILKSSWLPCPPERTGGGPRGGRPRPRLRATFVRLRHLQGVELSRQHHDYVATSRYRLCPASHFETEFGRVVRVAEFAVVMGVLLLGSERRFVGLGWLGSPTAFARLAGLGAGFSRALGEATDHGLGRQLARFKA